MSEMHGQEISSAVNRGAIGRSALLVGTLLAFDFVALISAGLLAAEIRFGTVLLPVDIGYPLPYWQASIIVAIMWSLALASEGLYNTDRLTWSMGEVSRAARALALGVLAVITLAFLLNRPGLSRIWLLIAWGIAVLLVAAGRVAARLGLSWMHRKGRFVQRTLIVGTNAEGGRIVTALRAMSAQGLRPVGCLALNHDDVGFVECSDEVPLLGASVDLAEVVSRHRIDVVIIASSAFDHDDIAAMISDLRGVPVSVHISSGLFEVLTSRVMVREVAGVPLITVKRISLSPLASWLKRSFDITVGGLMVLAGMPLWLLVAAAIKFTSRGPIFYRQERIGRHGRAFRMFKFRSMVPDADAIRDDLASENEADGPLFKMKEDPRVTVAGRWMRRFSIDEFPQLLNVLAGDMSLVGPRPPLGREVETYGEQEHRRLEVPPGMTGLWQVSGRSDLSFEEMVRLDLFYIENWSLGFDISLLLRTVPAILFGRGAY